MLLCASLSCALHFTAGPKSLKQFKMELTAVVVEQSRWRRSQLEMFITEAKMSTITADTTNAHILSLRPLKQDKMATMVSDQFGCIWGGGFNNKNSGRIQLSLSAIGYCISARLWSVRRSCKCICKDVYRQQLDRRLLHWEMYIGSGEKPKCRPTAGHCGFMI